MKALILLMSLALSTSINSQQSGHKQAAEERVRQVILELETEKQECDRLNISTCLLMEDFLNWLKEGKRGYGIHYPWMDKMKMLGVKQATITVHYTWKNGKYHLKAKEITYFSQYYLRLMKDKKLLQKIEAVGLDQDLRDAVLEKSQKYFDAEQKEKEEAPEGYTEYNLLDDEALPILDWVY